MLNFFRKQAQSPLIQGVVVVIALVFVFWGVGNNMGNKANTVVTVNDVRISYMDYRQAYDQAVNNFRQQFGGQIPPELMEQLGIKQQVLYRLIRSELLRQGGDAIGIMVSGRPVQQQIKQMQVFQEDGRFSMERYKTVLDQNRLTPTSFEEGLKADLRSDRIRNKVGSFAVVPGNAEDHWFAYTGEEIKFTYVKIDPADFADKVKVDEQELAAWFADRKVGYRSDPKVRLNYMFFNQEEDEKLVKPSEEELKARYEQERASYQQPEQRHARHILFKVKKDDAESARTAKRQKAEEVLALLHRQDSDFAALAKEYSEGPTKDRGGDLGFFPAGRMVPAFDTVVFSMETGTISNLVETEFGYHIIKLEEIRPASERSFEQVRDNLAAGIRKQKSRSLTLARADTAYKEVMRAGSLEKYSRQGKEEVVVTDYFSRSEPPEGVAAESKFLDTAFSLKKGELSSVVELKKGYTVIFVDDIQEPELPELEVVRDRVVADYTKDKAAELAAEAAQELLTAARKQGSLRTADTADNGEQNTVVTDFLKRSVPAGKNVPPNQVVTEGFKLPWNEKLAKEPVQVGTTWFVYEITERRAGAELTDDAERAKISERLLASTRNELVASWLGGLQAQGRIQINNELIK